MASHTQWLSSVTCAGSSTGRLRSSCSISQGTLHVILFRYDELLHFRVNNTRYYHSLSADNLHDSVSTFISTECLVGPDQIPVYWSIMLLLVVDVPLETRTKRPFVKKGSLHILVKLRFTRISVIRTDALVVLVEYHDH
jgi:hypothetical protein